MTAPTPAEVEALDARTRELHAMWHALAVQRRTDITWPDIVLSLLQTVDRLAAGYRLPSPDDGLRARVETLRDDIRAAISTPRLAAKSTAEVVIVGRWTEQARAFADALDALLAEAEPQPEPEGERCAGPHDFSAVATPCPACGWPYARTAPVPSPVAAEERRRVIANAITSGIGPEDFRPNPWYLADLVLEALASCAPEPVAAEERCPVLGCPGDPHYAPPGRSHTCTMGEWETAHLERTGCTCPSADHHRAPEPGCPLHGDTLPVAAAPDETVEALAYYRVEDLADWLHPRLEGRPFCAFNPKSLCPHTRGSLELAQSLIVEGGWVEDLMNARLRARGYLSPAEVARAVAEAKSEGWDEGRDAEIDWRAEQRRGVPQTERPANPYRAALAGGPDSEQPT